MEFLILGPIDVRTASGPVALGGVKPKAVLAVLLLHANEPVSAERLALALWGEDAPGGAVKTVQVHVSRLRKALGDADVIATTPAGYRLRVRPGELDAERFERLVEDARAALADARPEDASALLRDALALWRGPALAELAPEPFASAEIARLEEQRLTALELRVDADLAAGRHAEVVGELQRLVSAHPTRERLAGQLMLALYRCGRQSEALEAYGAARRVLVEEMGVEPGPQLRDLQAAILRQDVALEAQPAQAELPPQLDAATAPPLVGRADELDWLLARWDRARAGDGAVVTLSGPRGVGKQRLLAEAAGTIHRPGVAVLYATGEGPADALLAAVRRASEATRPTLLVVDAADRAGRGAMAELARRADAIATSPVLVVACAEDALALAHLRAADALELGPLGEEAVRAIAAQYAPATAAAELPAQWLLQASDGVPSRVHEVAGQWSRREAARHVDAAAGRAAAGRAQLRSIEAELTGGVVALQETSDREPPRGGGDEGGPVVCPFKGLASYDVGDARYFFGRERLVAELVARLVGSPLLGIVGPSGSGKSSLLRAGLLPALAGGVLPGSRDWPQVLLRPGAHPLEELAAGLARVERDGRIVLAVDQFEETFTVCEDEDERAEFVSELVKAAQDPDGRWVVVIALRADYYGRCAAYPELSAMLAAANVLVRPMAADELRRAIERPAQRAGLRIEPELVDALVADVEREPGGLPLMSTALLELWQRRDGRRLRHRAYAQSGGVHGAVARLAESAFAQLDAGQQTIARGVLMRLVGSGEGDGDGAQDAAAPGAIERRRVPLAELEIERDEDVARVVALLTDRRLLTVSAGAVELAHEALLREWPRLRGWIEDDREGLRIQRGLSSAAAEWERLGHDEGALYRGTRLTEALEWRDARRPVLSRLEREFLAAAEAGRERERVTRRRRTTLAGAALLTALLAVTAVVVAVIFTQREHDIGGSRELAARANSIVPSDPPRALAIALAAFDRRRTQEAERAVRQATLGDRSAAVAAIPRPAPAAPVFGYAIAFSPDARRLVTASEGGHVHVWGVAGLKLQATIKGHEIAAQAAAFDPQGARIASVGYDRTVAIAGADGSGRKVLLTLARDVYARSVEFSRDGRRLLIATSSGAVGQLAIDAKPARLVALGPPLGGRAKASFNRSATKVVAVGETGARMWDLARGTAIALGERGEIASGAFSPDERLVATAGADGIVRIFSAADGKPIREIRGDEVPVGSVRFSSDSRRIVTGDSGGTVRVFGVGGGPPLSELRGSEGAINDAAFVPGGDRVVSVGEDGMLRVWSPAKVEQVTTGEARTAYRQPGFSPAGDVVAGFDDGEVRVWSPRSGRQTVLRNGIPAPTEATYSADGRYIVSASLGGPVRLWDVRRRRSAAVPTQDEEAPKEAVAIDAGGRRIAIAAADAPIVVQDPDGGRRVAFEGHRGLVNALAFSSDGERLASGSDDGTVRTWNAVDGRPQRTLDAGGKVVDVAYDRDGSHVAAAAADGTVRIWPAGGGDPVLLYGHAGDVNSVAFGARDRLVSAGKDGTVRIWDTRRGVELLVLEAFRGEAAGAAFSSDGSRVVSADARGHALRISRCDLCGPFAAVLRQARSRPARALDSAERERLLSSGG